MFVTDSYVEKMKQFDAIKNGKPFIRKITEDAGVGFLSKSSQQEETKMQKTQSVEDIKRLLQNAYNEFSSRVRSIAREYQSLGSPNERVQTIFEETLAKVDSEVQASLARIEAESAPNLQSMLRERAIAKAQGRWR